MQISIPKVIKINTLEERHANSKSPTIQVFKASLILLEINKAPA
jgi:hypothetical protein